MIKKVLEMRNSNVKELLKEKTKFRIKCRKGKVKKIMEYYFDKNNYSINEIEKYLKFLKLYNLGEIFLTKTLRKKIKEGGKNRLYRKVQNKFCKSTFSAFYT